MVELVHHFLQTGFARELLTTGHFLEQKVPASAVEGLGGSKAKAIHLSADVAVRVAQGNLVLSAEIKSGLFQSEILNDLRIVRHYNEAPTCDRAELAPIRK